LKGGKRTLIELNGGGYRGGGRKREGEEGLKGRVWWMGCGWGETEEGKIVAVEEGGRKISTLK
jgi:hypothetical protein